MQREQSKGIQRAGVIGTGRIVNRFMPEADLADGIQVQAVYNPHLESAVRFAARWGLEACGDLTDFFQRVDLVYVASPPMKHMLPTSRRRWITANMYYVKSPLLLKGNMQKSCLHMQKDRISSYLKG
ncbi:MAG: Gfo/Idh/MocA family oxidoreductase [Clostridia bacterium]|nr:Gfo/Idh/MocA family oxidoreductase [Clostridia bacterium]